MASFGGRKPLIDVDLFEPLVVPASQLLLFYTALVAFDYLLLRNEPHLPLTGIPLRILLAIIHAFIPLAIVSPYAPYNLFFAACPWFIVSYTAALPTSRLSFSQYLNAFYAVVLDVTDDERLKMAQGQSENFGGSAALDPVGTRVRGLLKIGLGIGKWMLVTRCVDPLLPEKYSVLFSYSWLDPKSLALTLLLGIKAYLLLGVTDIGCGIEQMILGVRMVDLFHSPIISSSPMEFWSRRWNRAVRNLLHELIFLSSSKTDARGRYWRGLLVFFVSGLFHELIIMSCCRKMTLENLLFFTLHGAAVLAQVSVRVLTGSKCSPHSLMRIFCIASHLLFLTLTGRLFLAPFIRYNFLGIIVN